MKIDTTSEVGFFNDKSTKRYSTCVTGRVRKSRSKYLHQKSRKRLQVIKNLNGLLYFEMRSSLQYQGESWF